MKNFILPLAIALLCISSLSSCSKKTDVNAELENAAKTLAQTETPPPQPTVPPNHQAAAPAASTAAAPAPVHTPAQEMNQALAAYKSGQLEDAVTRLQRLRRQTAMTPEQLIAIQNATAAVMGEVYALAAKGDARAKQAVKEYERLQNSN